HDDDWISSSTATDTQLARLKALVKALAKMYDIKTLIMHREVTGRKGDSTVCPGDHLVPKITALRTELQMSAN
ncbi:MAG: N-acetylmuramoyl-L-alanine amidase, partial [Pseudomonadota bacterium]